MSIMVFWGRLVEVYSNPTSTMHFNRRPAGVLVLVLVAPVIASFQRDVVHSQRSRHTLLRQGSLNDALLEVAVPLPQYEQQTGLTLSHRKDEEGDDFQTVDNPYSFSGYSLKYAKCQPVQYFSEDAIKAGESSPMVIQDIVILRLCPRKACSKSQSYGCHYNYGEYALTLSEYTSVMLKYSAYKRDAICGYCTACLDDDAGRRTKRLNRRKLEEAANDDGAGEGGQDAAGDDAAAQDAAGDDADAENAQEGNNDGAEENIYAGTCEDFNSYCSNYASECEKDDDKYLDFEGYLDYTDCSEVQYNDYAYFVRPRCDGSTGTIKMAVFYDNYCMQYAGNDLSIKNLGLGFKEGFFENYYSSTCIDCSETESPPYFDANSLLCNNVHMHSAKCTSQMIYDLFESETDKATECIYIESLRDGAYDIYGKFSSKYGGSSSWDAPMTIGQGVLLGFAIALCVLFVVYACYLHHSMTNLLIKSLSHRELLPRKVRSRSRSSRERSNSRRSTKQKNESDWDGSNIA